MRPQMSFYPVHLIFSYYLILCTIWLTSGIMLSRVLLFSFPADNHGLSRAMPTTAELCPLSGSIRHLGCSNLLPSICCRANDWYSCLSCLFMQRKNLQSWKMFENILTIKILKETYKEWNQKILATISTSLKSASINRLCPKDVVEEITIRINFS